MIRDTTFTDISPEQIINHFEGITCMTTKNGLSDLLRELNWITSDALDISPRYHKINIYGISTPYDDYRCYNLGDPSHRAEFIDDFRLSAAVTILLLVSMHFAALTFPPSDDMHSGVWTSLSTETRLRRLCVIVYEHSAYQR